MTPEQFRARLARWAEGALPGLLQDMARDASVRIGARAVGTYMRDAKGTGEVSQATRLRFTKDGRIRRGGRRYTHSVRRAASDTGPLRIVSGALARALRPSGRGAISRVSTEGLRAKLEKGVDLGVVPYARIHEKGGLAGRRRGARGRFTRRARIPARPYLAPALADEEGNIKSVAERRFLAAVRKAVRTGGAA